MHDHEPETRRNSTATRCSALRFDAFTGSLLVALVGGRLLCCLAPAGLAGRLALTAHRLHVGRVQIEHRRAIGPELALLSEVGLRLIERAQCASRGGPRD